MLARLVTGQWQWAELPQIVKPRNGVVKFKPFNWNLSLREGYFEVEAFHCF